jgi:hypothetical protein
LEDRISLTLEGLPEDEGHVRLSEFLRGVQLLGGALRKLDQAIAGAQEPSSAYRVVELSHSSPARVTVAAVPLGTASAPVAAELLELITTIRNDARWAEHTRVPLDQGCLEDLKALGEMVGRKVARVTLASNGTSLELTQTMTRRIRDAIAPEERYPGFLRGMLEAINVHKNANTFHIYPDAGPRKVACVFTVGLTTKAVDGVGRFVQVRGTLRYKAYAAFPYAIDVTDLDILPHDSELPTLFDVKGIAPGLAAERNGETGN